jgi:putative Ca2+/H+ antiporter (TMEM165/GDT1 family)
MNAFLVAMSVVALAEIGDKTQLLALLLATQFKKPWPIILGITAATLLNHGLAGFLGTWITSLLSPSILRWILALSFLAMGVWALIPDHIETKEIQLGRRWGVFVSTCLTFFLAEMGDKTQAATVALSVHYANALMVVLGTTIGMLLIDVPTVWLAHRLAAKIPMRLVHRMAAIIFFLLGIGALLGTH